MSPKTTNPEASLDEATEPVPASFEDEPTNDEPAFDLDAWLGGATVMTASVDIVQNAGLLGRHAAWQRRYEAAKENAPADGDGAETGLGDESPLAELEREGAALRQQIEASTATWFVRALDSEERQAVVDAFPAPADPPRFTEPAPRLVPAPTDGQASAYLKAMSAWESRRDRFYEVNKDATAAWVKADRKVDIDRLAELVSRATVRVEVAGRVIAEASDAGPAIAAAQAGALIKTIGEVQFGKLGVAINQASEAEPEVPAAFLPEN